MEDQNRKFTTGDGRVVSLQDILDLYRGVVSQLMPISGKIKPVAGSQTYILTSIYDTIDCDQLERVKCSKSHLLTSEDGNNLNGLRVQPVMETNGQADIASAQSKSGKYLARIRSNPKGSDDKQILQIWAQSRLIKSIDVSELDTHGAINTDPVFSSLSWSKFDENKLLYICEKKKPKLHSYFKHDFTSCKDSINLANNHDRSEDWGECLPGIEHTILAVLDVADGCKISTLDMDGYSLGDSQWISSEQTVSVAYPEEPRRLGLIYCNSRPSILVVHDWSCSPPKEVRRIQEDTLSFTSPRVYEKGGSFVYLAAPTYGAHRHAQKIYNSECDKLLVDSHTRETDHFLDTLPQQCFLCKDRYMIFVRTINRSPPGVTTSKKMVDKALCQQLCLYDLEQSTLLDMKFPLSSVQLLDVRDDLVFVSGSDFMTRPSLYVAKVCADQPLEQLEWQEFEKQEKLDDITSKSFQIPTDDSGDCIGGFLVSPNVTKLQENMSAESRLSIEKEDDLPTVVLVHGGPHAGFNSTYIPVLVVYAKLGLRTLLINYRGSTGISEKYLNTLCGRVGELDVSDCLLAIRHFVEAGMINPKKLIIQGGSHGGFLTAHLSCQTEFKFTSAILRNPVIDISSMHTTSDIPDWCYTEALGAQTYEPTMLPDGQGVQKMFECSPLSKFRDAYVPSLILLGSRDKRVPMFQGERWYQLLKARGVKTKCKVYEDRHDLAKPETAVDSTITAIMWILENLEVNKHEGKSGPLEASISQA